MALKILHTADWHLGARLYNTPRDEEHNRFLSWLLEHIRQEGIDVLVVAGDVFHYTQPSAEATSLYYKFLADAASQTPLRQIVVVGGNHDSASRIDAPREVLNVLNVHVVGGLSARRETWDRCICPVRGDDGQVELVIVAVPFVHEFRLGVRTTGLDRDDAAVTIKAAFQELYTELADRAEALYPGVPLMTTGHLTCKGAPIAGYNTPIHLASLIQGLPAETIFDERYGYVALGHIHQMYRADDTNAWYSGSPIALNIVEARSPRYVLEATTPSGDDARAPFEVAQVLVPQHRAIVELRGSEEQIQTQLEALDTSEHDLPPLVWVDVEVPHYTPDVAKPLLDHMAQHPEDKRPRLVRVGQTLVAPEPRLGEEGPTSSLRDLEPEEVFTRLYRARNEGQDPRDILIESFRRAFQQATQDDDRGSRA